MTRLTIQRLLKIPFDSQHVKRFQTLVKSAWENFYHIFSLMWGEMIWKISHCLKFEMRGLFANTWTANYKYPFMDCENLLFSIQIQLSLIKKHFLSFLFDWWNLQQILNILKQKKIVIANAFPKLATVHGLVTPLTIQRRLKTSFDSQHVQRFQTLVKSSWAHFYHIFHHCEEKWFGKYLPDWSLKS